MKEAEKTPAPFVPVAGKCNKVQMSICNYYKSAAMNYQCGGGDEWFNDNCCCEGEAESHLTWAVTPAPAAKKCIKNKRSDCDVFHRKYNFNYNCPVSGPHWWFQNECCEYCQGKAPTVKKRTCERNVYADRQCRDYHSHPDYACTDKTRLGRFMLKNCCETCKSGKPSQCENVASRATCEKYRSQRTEYDCSKDTYSGRWMKQYCCAYCEGAAAVTAAPKTQCLKNRVSASRCKKYHGMANVGFVCGDSGYNGKWFDRNCCKFCEELSGPVPAGTVPETAAVRCDGPQADEARCRGYYMQRGWRCDQSNNHNKWYSQNCCKYCSF